MPKYTPGQRELAQVKNAFTYHPAVEAEGQAERYDDIREEARQYALFLLENCPPSRELSLALTNLEQAVFWANAAIARHEGPREAP